MSTIAAVSTHPPVNLRLNGTPIKERPTGQTPIYYPRKRALYEWNPNRFAIIPHMPRPGKGSDFLLLVLCMVLAAVLFSLGYVFNSHNTVWASLCINLSASFVIVALTIGFIERKQASRQEKRLSPSRRQALNEVDDVLGDGFINVYSLIKVAYTQPIALKRAAREATKPYVYKEYRPLHIWVLRELNSDPDLVFIKDSDIDEEDYVNLIKTLDTVQSGIERVRMKYEYSLNQHLNEVLLDIVRTVKPLPARSPLRLVFGPPLLTKIGRREIATISQIITSLLDANEKVTVLIKTMG